MNISFDENTKKALLESLEKQNKSSVRLKIKGIGWGGPLLGAALDEPQADDEVFTVDNVRFAVEPDISHLFDGSKIVYTKGIFGNGFNVIPKDGNRGC